MNNLEEMESKASFESDGRAGRVIIWVAGAFLTFVVFVAVAGAAPVPEVAAATESEGRADEVKKALAWALYPDGYPASDVGALSGFAAAQGRVVYRDGRKFDRTQIRHQIAEHLMMLRDLELLEMKNELARLRSLEEARYGK
jgi:hypothetical protein